MEILLLEDINGMGKKNDVLVVGDGFALNYLLPQRKALVATPTVRKRYAEQIRRRAEEKETERKHQSDILASIAGRSLTFQRKASKTGKLYASLTEKNIAEALRAQYKVDISEESIVLPEHIKSLGNHAVQVKVGGQTQSLNVVVAAEAAKEAVAK